MAACLCWPRHLAVRAGAVRLPARGHAADPDGSVTSLIPARIETARLVLRTWRPADRPAFAEINSDPEVTEHVGGRPLTRAESDAIVVRAERSWEERGYGWYALESQETDDLLGFPVCSTTGPYRPMSKSAGGSPATVGPRTRHRSGVGLSRPRLRRARSRPADFGHDRGEHPLVAGHGEARDAAVAPTALRVLEAVDLGHDCEGPLLGGT